MFTKNKTKDSLKDAPEELVLLVHHIIHQMSHTHSPRVLTQVEKVVYEIFRAVSCTESKMSGYRKSHFLDLLLVPLHRFFVSMYCALSNKTKANICYSTYSVTSNNLAVLDMEKRCRSERETKETTTERGSWHYVEFCIGAKLQCQFCWIISVLLHFWLKYACAK